MQIKFIDIKTEKEILKNIKVDTKQLMITTMLSGISIKNDENNIFYQIDRTLNPTLSYDNYWNPILTYYINQVYNINY